MAIKFRSFGEKKLASFQQEQTGNNCAVFSTCAALNLLLGLELNPLQWSEKIDDLPIPSILKYRMFHNGPVTPIQHVHLIQWVLEEHQIADVQVDRGNETAEELMLGLTQPNQVKLVTIGWFYEAPPEITYGTSAVNQNASRARVGFHTLILAAYDPLHISKDGIQRPWGFINSWKSSAEKLYWMQAIEFLHSWNIFTPMGGRRSVVTISRL